MAAHIPFSDFPHFAQAMYRQGIALYDTLNGFQKGEDGETEFVDYPVRALMVIFILCVRGQMKMRLNLKDYELSNGDVIIVRPSTIFESLRLSRGARVIALMVADSFFHVFPQKHVSRSGLLSAFVPAVLHANEDTVTHLIRIYQQMLSVIRDDDFHYKEDALKGYLQVVTSLLEDMHEHMEAQKGRQTDKTKRSEVIYSRFVSDVHLHFREHRETAFYAGLQCVTPKYFGQMIRRACGRMPSDVIGEHVILEAKLLLRSERYTVQQVADMLNFPNPSFFGKYFKAHVGQTPRQFAELTDIKEVGGKR